MRELYCTLCLEGVLVSPKREYGLCSTSADFFMKHKSVPEYRNKGFYTSCLPNNEEIGCIFVFSVSFQIFKISIGVPRCLSRIRVFSFRIRDPGSKKFPDPGSGSASASKNLIVFLFLFFFFNPIFFLLKKKASAAFITNYVTGLNNT
jgi:hypothetical protein